MSFSFTQMIRSGDVVTDVFQKQKAMMPSGGQVMVAPENWAQTWEMILEEPIENHSLAYIHIPFCINHCVFCGFYKNKWKEDHGTPYVDRLIAELANEAAKRVKGEGKIDAVYFGGGTPTILSAADLSRLIHATRTYLPLSDNCEITIEGRMSHFTQDKIDACLDAGANRFSIGMQTFDSKIRRRLGRKHSGEEAIKYMTHLASHQQAVVVLDLIYGLPGQSNEIWQNDIETALKLGLDGLDVYSFKCFPSLPINRMIEKGAFPALPDVLAQASQYAYAVRRMEAEGWSQISNSHFAAPNEKERNIYNSQIKFGTPFLSFGSGAGGCHAGYSYSVTGDLNEYLQTPLDMKPLGYLSKTAQNRSLLERIKGSIETGRVNCNILPQSEQIKLLLNEWQEKKLIILDDNQAKLTLAGRFWGTGINRALVEAIS